MVLLNSLPFSLLHCKFALLGTNFIWSSMFWSLLPFSSPNPLNEGNLFVSLALVGKDIVFRFIIEYSSLRDFGP